MTDSEMLLYIFGIFDESSLNDQVLKDFKKFNDRLLYLDNPFKDCSNIQVNETAYARVQEYLPDNLTKDKFYDLATKGFTDRIYKLKYERAERFCQLVETQSVATL